MILRRRSHKLANQSGISGSILPDEDFHFLQLTHPRVGSIASSVGAPPTIRSCSKWGWSESCSCHRRSNSPARKSSRRPSRRELSFLRCSVELDGSHSAEWWVRCMRPLWRSTRVDNLMIGMALFLGCNNHVLWNVASYINFSPSSMAGTL